MWYWAFTYKTRTGRFPVGTEVDDYKIKEWYMEDITTALQAAKKQASILSTDDEHIVIALTSVNYQLGRSWTKKFRLLGNVYVIKNMIVLLMK